MFTPLKLILIFISFVCFICNNANSTDNLKQLPLTAYSALKSKSMLTVSPNGNLVAYRMTDQNRDLFVVIDIHKGKRISTLNITEIQPEKAYFINDEQLVFVVSKYQRIAGFKGRHNVNTALIFTIANNKIEVLLRAGHGVSYGQAGLGTIVGISSDGNWAYMPAYTGKGGRGVPYKYSLMAVNLKYPKRKPRIHSMGTSDTTDYFLNPNNNDEVLARERYNNEDDLHSIEVLEDDEWRVVFQETISYMTKSFVGVTADGRSLVMLENSKKKGSVYYLLSLSDGKFTASSFFKKGKEIESTLSDINRVIDGVRYAGFKPSYAFFDSKLQEKLSFTQKELPNSSIGITAHTNDWKKIIFYVEGDGLTGDYLYLENGQLGHVGSARSNITWEAVNNVVEFSYKARDGLTIPTLLTIPNNVINSKERLPAVIIPHGGPESYDRSNFNWLSQYFASRGFLVIQPQFRGSDGFGAAHTLKGRGEWGKKMQDDLTDAVNKLVDIGAIDKDRVCIVGLSYGGYAALAGASFTPELYQCAIAINGVSDIDLMMKLERKNYGKNHWVVSYWEDVLKSSKYSDDYLSTISPINFVEKIEIPMLLIASLDDKVVNPVQSSIMYDALDDADKKVVYVEIEDEGHHLYKANSRLKVLQAIDKFIYQYNAPN